ncbi:MAG TPA: Wzy polymerase domain-containing protein [Rubrivivax sp.]|nr:Wzy polymerase domain-containing protein [Rubrivivax sp.]
MSASAPAVPGWRPLRAAALLAVVPPTLLAWNVSPSATFLNQALSLGGWAVFLLWLAPGPDSPARAPAGRAAWPLQAALALLAIAAIASGTLGSLPGSLMRSALGLLAMAALVVQSGVFARARAQGHEAFVAFAWAWLVAGLLGVAIGLVQVFAPEWADGNWIAASSMPGRAVGNLRQPNHLSSVLLWGAIATIMLMQLRRLPQAPAAAVFVALVFGVVLTASRTGLVSVLILALWGAVDRRLSSRVRLLLLAAPVVYALAWLVMAQWAELTRHTFGGAARLAETDISSSRFGIWRDTLALIRAQPWTGVGFGEFNLAWTLTPFPGRPTAFFDHAHNLPLQFAVELGLPLATLVLALLLAALVQLALRARRAEGEDAITQRMALMFVLMIGLHSLLEYPLWYAYFLLPTAWAWGYGLGQPGGTRSMQRDSGDDGARVQAPMPSIQRPRRDAQSRASLPQRLIAPAAALALALTAFAVWDYARVTTIYAAGTSALPLEERIDRGQHSPFFAYQADYAAATTEVDGRMRALGLARATHFLLDTRLMIAWAEDLARRGEIERARHLADRLREFHNPASSEWFAQCDDAQASERPFQCAYATRGFSWRDFTPPPSGTTP